MNDEQYSALMERLEILTKLVSLIAVPKDVTVNDKVRALASLGLRPKDIGWLIGKDPQRINEILYKQRQDAKKQNTEG